MDWTLARTYVRMRVCSNDGVNSGRRDPWRPVPGGRGVGKRFARPTGHPGSRASPAGLTTDLGASPGGVMTMIPTLTAAGAPARNAVPTDAVPVDTVPTNTVPTNTVPTNTVPTD